MEKPEGERKEAIKSIPKDKGVSRLRVGRDGNENKECAGKTGEYENGLDATHPRTLYNSLEILRAHQLSNGESCMRRFGLDGNSV